MTNAMFRSLPLLVLVALVASGCGDDDVDAQRSEYLPAPSAPLTLGAAERGLPFFPYASYVAHGERLPAIAEAVPTLVLRSQIASEYMLVRGAPGQTASARLPAVVERALTLGAMADVSESFSRVVLVVDLMKLDGAWLMDSRAAGREREPARRNELQLGNESAREEIRTQVLEAVAALGDRPVDVVLGAEMERWYLLNPDDWSGYATLVREVRDALRAAHGERVRVGAGIDLYRFVHEIAASWSLEPDEEAPAEETQTTALSSTAEGASPSWPMFEAAWQEVMEPLLLELDERERPVRALDFVAVSFVPNPAGLPRGVDDLSDLSLAGLRTWLARNGLSEYRVLWYAIGWPTSVGAGQERQRFATRFLALAGGMPTDLVAWHGYQHLQPGGECDAMTGSRISAPSSICFQGLWRATGESVSRDLVSIMLGVTAP